MSSIKKISETEERILKAAEHEFINKGFAGARTTVIAEAAGVTHAMLHYYFRTKENLFTTVLENKMRLLKDLVIKSIANENLSFEDKIKNIIDTHLDFIYQNPDIPRFLVSEIWSDPNRSRFLKQQIALFGKNIIIPIQKELDQKAKEGIYRNYNASRLLIDIIALNIFPFLASPLVNLIMQDNKVESLEFINERKIENFDTIMRKIKP